MSEQLGLFDAAQVVEQRARHREHWGLCWDWMPQVGEMASFHSLSATATDGEQQYTFGAGCKILDHPGDDQWLVEYRFHEAHCANGKQFLLHDIDLWPCISHLNGPRLIRTEEQYLAEGVKLSEHWAQIEATRKPKRKKP